MEEKVISIIPTVMSGVGSFVVVNVGDSCYKTDIVQKELTQEVVNNLIEKLLPTIPEEDREAVELKYYQLIEAMKNTEEEQKYRAEHPEKFKMNLMEDQSINEEIVGE